MRAHDTQRMTCNTPFGYHGGVNDTIAPPPVREPRPVMDEPALTGKRVIVAQADADMPDLTQYVRDYRAAGEVFIQGGRAYVRIVPELVWYAWTTDPNPNKTPACPRAKAWPAEFVWVE